MPTVYLHIGAPKTATSTLQRLLSKNYQQLRKSGILYPKSCRSGDAHHVLACDLIEAHQEITMPDLWYGDIPRQASWQMLREEIEANSDGLETIILSTELLFGQNHRLHQMLDEVKTRLSGHDIKVIAYLRRQDQLFSSFYNQDVKGARQWPGTAYEFYETHQLLRNDYVTVVQSWTAAFGRENILLRPFEKEQWVDASAIADFCATIGIPHIKGSFRDQNESIGATQLFLKRCLNSAGFPKRQNEEVLALLKDIFPEKPAKGLLYVNKPLYNKYRARWLEVNKTLSKKYLNSKPLFSQPIPEVDEVELYTINIEDMPVLIGNCLKVLGKKANSSYRPLFAKAIILAAIEQHFWEKLPGPARDTLQDWLSQA